MFLKFTRANSKIFYDNISKIEVIEKLYNGYDSKHGYLFDSIGNLHDEDKFILFIYWW